MAQLSKEYEKGIYSQASDEKHCPRVFKIHICSKLDPNATVFKPH